VGPFNNREIATAFWWIVFLGWALSKSEIRKSIVALPRAIFRFKSLLPFCLMAIYTTAAVMLLAAVDLWKVSLLKDTIVWFCVFAITMMMRFVTSGKAENIFQKILADSIKIIIVLEFLVNTYTFPIVVELILVPALTFVAMLGALAESGKKYSVDSKIINRIQVIVGFVIFGIVASCAISDLQNLKNMDTFRSIVLAPLLSLLLSPFLYVMVLASKYELVFLRIDLGMEKERGLRRYARYRILMYAGLSLRKVQYILRNNTADLMHIQTKDDIDRIVESMTDKPKRQGNKHNQF
jgi:hypothetical protein